MLVPEIVEVGILDMRGVRLSISQYCTLFVLKAECIYISYTTSKSGICFEEIVCNEMNYLKYSSKSTKYAFSNKVFSLIFQVKCV